MKRVGCTTPRSTMGLPRLPKGGERNGRRKRSMPTVQVVKRVQYSHEDLGANLTCESLPVRPG